MKTSWRAKCSLPVSVPGSKRSLLKLSNNIYTNIYIYFFLLLIFFRERMAALVLGVIKELEDKRFVDTVAEARVV